MLSALKAELACFTEILIPPEQKTQLQTAETRRITGDRVKTSNLTPYSSSAPMVNP